MSFKKVVIPITIALSASVVFFLYWKFTKIPYLTFSDAAKFADVARQVVNGRGYTSNFIFFNPGDFFNYSGRTMLPTNWPPLFPLSLAVVFLIFGVSDLSVILTSGLFFIMSAVLLFFLGKKLFDTKVGIVSALVFIFTPAMLEYATLGASESLFIFEIILIAYLLISNSQKAAFFAGVIAGLMFLTRLQAIIYFVCFFIMSFLLKDNKKTINFLIGAVSLLGFMGVAEKITHLFPFPRLSLSLAFEHSSAAADNVTLRGGVANYKIADIFLGARVLVVKVFYHLYNFYKTLPDFFSPFFLTFFIVSLFKKEDDGKIFALKISSLLILVFSFVAASLTIPFIRYIHPVIPLIIVFSVAFLFYLVKTLNKSYLYVYVLVLFFVVGLTFGKIFLDSRYQAQLVNKDKPPVTFLLGKILNSQTRPDELIVTNLDTWGGWYGERKTVWLPFEPDQLIPKDTGKTKIDVLFIISYLASDPAQALGKNWQQVLDNPEVINNSFLKENFKVVNKFKISPASNYNRETVAGIILRRQP